MLVGGICFFYMVQVVLSFVGALCIRTFAGNHRVFLSVGTGFLCTW